MLPFVVVRLPLPAHFSSSASHTNASHHQITFSRATRLYMLFAMSSYPHLLRRDRREQAGVGLLPGLEVELGSRQCARKTVVVGNTLNTVGRVDVLDQRDLVAGSTTLAGDDGGVGQEELPDLFSQKGKSRLSARALIYTSAISWMKRGKRVIPGTISCRTWPQPCPGWPSSFCTTATE